MTANPLGFAGSTHQTARTRHGWSKALQLAPDLYPGVGGKRFRATLLERAYAFAGGSGPAPVLIVDAVEMLHAGSLVIDDFEDDSLTRRGQPALHRVIGPARAVNAGNWMYFRALELAAAAAEDSAGTAALVGRFITVARQCHEGQAIDLATRVDEVMPRQAQVTALAISRWKTGRLASLAAWCGAQAAAGDRQTLQAVAGFGCRVGICLQMKNDLDELRELVAGSDRCDDLRNRRVTWPWAWAASVLPASQFAAWQHRLRQEGDEPAALRPLAKDLLDATHAPAAAAINARLDRATGRLAAATGRVRDAAPLSAVCDALRISSQPSTAEALFVSPSSVAGRRSPRPGTHSPRRAAVIGSGFGGLAAAIRLQSMGFETVCYEAHDQPGGRAAVYEDSGYVFDAGPTVITAPHCLEELFELSDRRLADYVRLVPVTPLYRLQWGDGVAFDYVADEEGLIEQVRRVNPADVDGYRRFADYARRVFRAGYEELGAVPFLHFTDMIRAAPQLACLRADRSVYATVSRFVRDEHLRQAFSFHPLLVGGNPLETSSIYTLIHWIERKWGVFFPEGGTGALVRGLVRLFQDLGGTLRLAVPVDHVTLETVGAATRHVVHASGGLPEAFDVVVSNADVHHTYARLYRGVDAARRRQRRIERMTWSMSLFVLYFGTNRRYPHLAHHTILFGPRFQGLLRDVFHGHRLPEDFSLYLHAPTITDPGMAPPGGESFYVLSPVPHLGNAAIDWETVAGRYGDAILASLEPHLPGVRDAVVTRRHCTPADFASRFQAHHGSAFSVAPTLTQTAYFRPHNRDPDIPGLYLVGAGTHPGAGVPGVVNSAKATCDTIAADYHAIASGDAMGNPG